MHKALVVDNTEEYWFASLDGECFVPINREPFEEDATTVESILTGKSTPGFLPMTYHKRFLLHWHAIITE